MSKVKNICQEMLKVRLTTNKIRGNYKRITEWMRKKQVYTKSQIVAEMLTYGIEVTAAEATKGVMISPRLSSKIGNCCGNMANPWGDIAYNKLLDRKVISGVKEEQKYKFTYRESPLAPHKRKAKVSIVSEKVEVEAIAKTETKTETKAKAKAKAKSKAKVAVK